MSKRPDRRVPGMTINHPLVHPNLPHEIIEIMIEKLDLFYGVDILVSSAGMAEIAHGIRKACPEAVISCVEYDKSLGRTLESKGCYLMNAGDFLKIDCWPGFDRIALIPAFMNGQEIKYVRHALLMLKPGGRLVTIVSAPESFRAWLNEDGCEIAELPKASSFNSMGATTTKLHILAINKPEERDGRATAAADEVETIHSFSREKVRQVVPVTVTGA